MEPWVPKMPAEILSSPHEDRVGKGLNALEIVEIFFSGLRPAPRQGYRPGPTTRAFTHPISTPDRASSHAHHTVGRVGTESESGRSATQRWDRITQSTTCSVEISL